MQSQNSKTIEKRASDVEMMQTPHGREASNEPSADKDRVANTSSQSHQSQGREVFEDEDDPEESTALIPTDEGLLNASEYR